MGVYYRKYIAMLALLVIFGIIKMSLDQWKEDKIIEGTTIEEYEECF